MKDAAKTYFEYAKKTRTPIHDTETEKLFDLLNPNNYEKGAWVLHQLCTSLGDKAFFAGLRSYYESKRSTVATTEDLRFWLEKASGQDLHVFFERWVYKAGHPVYKVSWMETKPGWIDLKLEQTQTDEAFTNPVTLQIVTAKGSKRITLTPGDKALIVKVNTAKPKKIVIDPDDVILNEEAQ